MNSVRLFEKPVLLWGLASLFFAFQFILRLSVGILREDIIQKFAIDTIAFGTLAGYYYLGYSGMQIPIGMLLDKFDLKIITFSSIFITSVGTILFVVSPHWYYLLAARFLIGAGSAVGFLSTVKIIKVYFLPQKHSIMLGWSFTFGFIGAVLGIAPMKLLFDYFGYNNVFYALSLTGILIGLLMLSINIRSVKPYDKIEKPAVKIFDLLLNPKILLLGICGGLMVGSLEGFADVWAIPFFKVIHNMNDVDSNLITSCIYIGICCGGPILALFSDFFKSPSFVIIIAAALTILIFIILLYTPFLSFYLCCIIMLLLGVFCCYQILIFTIISKIVEKPSVGQAIAIINSINMSFGYFFHALMANIIERNCNGNINFQGIPVYTKTDLIHSITVIPICCFIGIICFIFVNKYLLKEK